MNLFARLGSRIAGSLGYIRQSAFAEAVMALLRGGMPTRAGVSLNTQTALGVATVLACCRVIAEGLGALPCQLRQRTEEGSSEVTNHPAAWILDTPNDWMTWQEFVETLTLHAVLIGNGFALIQRGVQGQVLALLPLRPEWVRYRQLTDWSIEYRVTWPDGSQRIVPFADMFHLRGPSWDAVAGLEIVRLAREAIGLAAAIEWTQAQHFGKGGQPGGILTTDAKVTEDQAKEWKERWRKANGGDENGGIAVLGNGARFQAVTFDFVSAQTLDARRMQVEEICRVFRVFPQMIGAGDKTSTYASAESFFTAHVVHTLTPWAVRWEQTLRRDLLTERQRGTMFFKMVLQAMLRGDMRSRSAFYHFAIADGWMVRNEARQLEDLNKLPGLDVPLQPTNMQPGDAALLNESPNPPPAA